MFYRNDDIFQHPTRLVVPIEILPEKLSRIQLRLNDNNPKHHKISSPPDNKPRFLDNADIFVKHRVQSHPDIENSISNEQSHRIIFNQCNILTFIDQLCHWK